MPANRLAPKKCPAKSPTTKRTKRTITASLPKTPTEPPTGTTKRSRRNPRSSRTSPARSHPDVTPTSATLEAMVNPNRWLTVYAFEYGPTETYGESTEISHRSARTRPSIPSATRSAASCPAPVPLPGGRDQLHGHHLRARRGVHHAGCPADRLRVVLRHRRRPAPTSAQRQPERVSPTTVKFEYGITGAYGQATTPVSIGSEGAEHQVGADLSGLAPGDHYHFRAVRSNELGTTTGTDQTFTTQAATPPPPPTEPEVKKCKRGFVKRHGRCVKRRHRKHHRGTGNGRG